MNKDVIIFSLILILTSLLQVSFVALPFGVAVLLFWYLQRGVESLVFLIAIFSISLGIAANIPIWVVATATGISAYLFIFGRSILPEKRLVAVGLILASLLVWELATFNMLRFFNL